MHRNTVLLSATFLTDQLTRILSRLTACVRMSLPNPCIAQISPAQKHEESASLQSEQGLNEFNLTLSYGDICKLRAHSQGIAICQCPIPVREDLVPLVCCRAVYNISDDLSNVRERQLLREQLLLEDHLLGRNHGMLVCH